MADRYEVHVDELVLYGFSPGDRAAVAAAVTRELSRLVEDSGVPSAGSSVWRVDGGRVDLPYGASPDAVGIAVARAIHGGIGVPR